MNKLIKYFIPKRLKYVYATSTCAVSTVFEIQ